MAVAQLPPDVADFTGREGPVGWLRAQLAGRDRAPAAVAAVVGKPGVGKTALACMPRTSYGRRFPMSSCM